MSDMLRLARTAGLFCHFTLGALKIHLRSAWLAATALTNFVPCFTSYSLEQAVGGIAQTNLHWQVEAGPWKLDLYVSQTAHLFHVMDQISLWSEFCHRQYLSWFLSNQQSNLTAFTQTASRFVGGTNLAIPVYLLANPDPQSVGGGFNGGQLTLEIAAQATTYRTLLHELFHAYLKTKQERIEQAAHETHG